MDLFTEVFSGEELAIFRQQGYLCPVWSANPVQINPVPMANKSHWDYLSVAPKFQTSSRYKSFDWRLNPGWKHQPKSKPYLFSATFNSVIFCLLINMAVGNTGLLMGSLCRWKRQAARLSFHFHFASMNRDQPRLYQCPLSSAVVLKFACCFREALFKMEIMAQYKDEIHKPHTCMFICCPMYFCLESAVCLKVTQQKGTNFCRYKNSFPGENAAKRKFRMRKSWTSLRI